MSQLHDALSNRYDLNQDMRRQRILESLHTEDYDLMPDEEDQPMTDAEFAALNTAEDAAHAAEVATLMARVAELEAERYSLREGLAAISCLADYNLKRWPFNSLTDDDNSELVPAQPVTGEAAA